MESNFSVDKQILVEIKEIVVVITKEEIEVRNMVIEGVKKSQKIIEILMNLLKMLQKLSSTGNLLITMISNSDHH